MTEGLDLGSGRRKNRRRSDTDLDAEPLLVLIRFLRKWLRRFFALFVIAWIALLGLTELVGERNLFTTFFLYLPQIWFFPLGCFVTAAVLLLDWRLVITTIALILGFTWFYLDIEINGEGKGKGGKEISVMTFNRGQRSGSLRPFKQRHQPDVIAMQEAGGNTPRYIGAEGYEDLPFGDDIGEFMLLSKHPITDKGLLTFELDRPHPVAAWFVVDFEGTEVVVYNVHLDTPRDQLKAYYRGAFLHGLWPFSKSAKSYQSFWDRQIEIAGMLRAHMDAETRPVIAVGDFNMPDHGYIYRKISKGLQDSHEKRGAGFGTTFPGATKIPPFGPFLRLDHQFADEHWRVLNSVAERGRKSQHLAVFAKYELRK